MLIRNCFLGLLIALFTLNAYAMRCDGKLVEEGDSDFDVLSKCGEPLYKNTYEQSTPQYDYQGYQIGVVNTSVTKWFYQKSPSEFRYELIFESGVLKKIDANRNP